VAPGSASKPEVEPHTGPRYTARLFERAIVGAEMFAVIKTGGKQYRVASGDQLKVEKLAGEIGSEIVLDQVLAVGQGAELALGSPLVTGASVRATVVSQGRHDKVTIFKMRRRKHYKKSQGHRQSYTEIRIDAITV